ncbi:MAG: AEC family transporter [Verrucomicrobia bacterium]|nr:AEC family transporter [Verrucomicrobiota bacterium]
MLHSIVQALLPVAFVVLLGWASAALKVLKREQAGILAILVVDFALPCSLFAGVMKLSVADLTNVPYFLAMFVGLMGIYLVGLMLGVFVFRNSLGESALQGGVSAFPSMAYSGLPVLTAIVGSEGILAVLIGNLITSIFMVPTTLVLLELSAAKGKTTAKGSMVQLILANLLSAVKQPVVWLPVAGLVLALCGVKLPDVLNSSFGLIGQTAAGVALFALGLMLYGQKFTLDAQIATNVFLKNVAQVILMLLLVLALGIKNNAGKELILTGAIPSATAVSMFAVKYGIYTARASASTLISTVLSVVTISLTIAFVTRWP